MALEIERKFLVNHHEWHAAEKPVGELYRQGYLLADPNKTIRVRLTPSSAYLTIKGPAVGITRPEYEYEIPQAEARELLDKFAVSELSKIRYKIKFRDKIWEVDEFLGDSLGLIVAEIELAAEEEQFELPAWAGIEVTSEKKYSNSSLAANPYKNW